MTIPYPVDLHIHTVLSPCAEVEMIPPLIIDQGQRMGLKIMAVTDHNSSRNAAAVIKAAEGTGITILPGMELQTKEEVHLLCLFETINQSDAWQDIVFKSLPPLPNNEDHFGPQYIVDHEGEYVATEEQMLSISSHLSLEEAIAGVHQLGGLAIPSHVDRDSFSLLANLGFIPPGLNVDGMEVSRHFLPQKGYIKYPDLQNWSLIMDGDAHQLNQIICRTIFHMESPSLQEIRKALRKEEGRYLEIHWPENRNHS